MQVSVTDAGPLRKQVSITYDDQEVAKREQALLTRYAGRMNLKGFRSGKVPPKLVKQRFGKAVTAEVREALGNEGLQQAIQEHALKPIGPITSDEADVEQGGDESGFSFSASFDVQPPIELPDPKSLDIPIEETSASEDEVQEELDGILRRAGDHRELDEGETIESDDAVTLTGKITSGEETVREVQDLNHLVGAYPLFGLEPEQVVERFAGKKTGDTFEFETTLPEGFKPEEWAEKPAQVSVTIQRAQRLQPATLDDELAKRLGTESVDQLRERIQSMVESRKENDLHGRQIEALVDELIAKTTFDLPPTLFENVLDQRIAEEVSRAKQTDADLDVETFKTDKKGEVSGEVERDLRRHLLMQAIADARQVQTTQQDLQQQISMAAYQSGRQPQELLKQLQESGRLQDVVADIRNHKALEIFLSEAVGGDEAQPAATTGGDAGEEGGEQA